MDFSGEGIESIKSSSSSHGIAVVEEDVLVLLPLLALMFGMAEAEERVEETLAVELLKVDLAVEELICCINAESSGSSGGGTFLCIPRLIKCTGDLHSLRDRGINVGGLPSFFNSSKFGG